MILGNSPVPPAGYTLVGANALGNHWVSVAPVPTAREFLVTAAVNGRVYAIGGLAPGIALNTVEVYDPSSNSWSPAVNMPTARYGLAATAVNGKIYAIGGLAGTIPVNTVEVYDPSNNSWSTAANMPTARATEKRLWRERSTVRQILMRPISM